MYGSAHGRLSLETLATATGIKSVLVISQVIKDDQGLYSCGMSNPFGTDSENIKVIVQGKTILKISAASRPRSLSSYLIPYPLAHK